MLKTKEVEVSTNGKNIKYYENKGYHIPKYFNAKKKKMCTNQIGKIKVKVDDLPQSSTVKVDVECDCCNKNINITYDNYLQCVKENGIYYCRECTPLYYHKSFYDWCIENNHQDYLDLWDYELNDKTPKTIVAGSSHYVYFKCPRRIHESSKKKLSTIVKHEYKNGICDKCNSFGQWMIDNEGNLNSWSDSNTIDPFAIGIHSSTTKAWIICKNCKNEKYINIGQYVSNGLSCQHCGDGMPSTEKFMSSMLRQLNVNFIFQLTKSKFSWCENYKYDFYLTDYKIIIEMDGAFHNKVHSKSIKTLEELKKIDKYKTEIALNNGVYVIRINCDYPNEIYKFDFMKNNIVSSPLNNIFDLSKVNWNKCEKESKSSNIVKACDIYNNITKSTTEISKIMNHPLSVIITWLTQGSNIGLCDYNPKISITNSREYAKQKCREKCNKKVEVFNKDGESLGIFESATVLCNKSEELFGVRFRIEKVSDVANGKRPHHRNYLFKYI